ncbi:MAG: hypothetical protein Q4Q31_03245 [Bacillota bacterium]|nr:hypothetical protein [Bacillota bacterium]
MFKNFFKKANDEDIFETVDPIVEQRRNEKFSKPLIYDEEFKKEQEANKKKEETLKKEKVKEVPKKPVKQAVPKVEEPVSKKGYEMIDIISPMFGMKEEKVETERVTKKPTVKKSKKKDNSLIQVISPYYGNFEEKEVEEESEAILTSAPEETVEEVQEEKEPEKKEELLEEEKLPTVEDNLRNIANIVKEEQNQLKIIEERTGEFKLDFGANKDEEKTTLIDEIDDNMSLDELMSLYEKKFKD